MIPRDWLILENIVQQLLLKIVKILVEAIFRVGYMEVVEIAVGWEIIKQLQDIFNQLQILI